jgi:hypothetical protein
MEWTKIITNICNYPLAHCGSKKGFDSYGGGIKKETGKGTKSVWFVGW